MPAIRNIRRRRARSRRFEAILGRVAYSAPKSQRQRPLTWHDCLAKCRGDRARVLRMACREDGVTMMALAQQAGLSVTNISRLIAAEEFRA